jgi:hypothetical protein
LVRSGDGCVAEGGEGKLHDGPEMGAVPVREEKREPEYK